MSIDLTGNSFTAIDSEGAGDGTTDATTRFLSAHGERLQHSNARYLRGLSHRTPITPYVKFDPDGAAGRLHTSAEETAYISAPWYFGRGTTGLTVKFLANVDDNGGTNAAQMTCRVVAGNIDKTVEFDEAAGVNSYTVDITGIVAAQPQWLPVQVWLQSTGTRTIVSSSTSVSAYPYGSTIDADSGLTDTSGDIDEGTILVVTQDQGVQRTATPMHVRPSTKITPVVYADEYPGASATDTATVEVQDASYIRIYSMSIETTQSPDKTAGKWSDKPISEMYAKAPVLGQHTGQHGSNADALYEAPRCLAFGPDGTQAPETTWPTDYHARWRWTYGDTGGTLQDSGVKLHCENGQLQLRGQLAGVHLIDDFGTTSIDSLESRAARTDWDLTMTVEQIGPSGWSDAVAVASTTRTEAIPCYPSSQSGEWPLLLQMYWAYFSDGGGKTGNLYDWIFHEGQLWPNDIAQILTEFYLSVDISGVDITQPTRVRLDASLNGTPDYRAGTPTEKTTERLQLLNVGTTVWEFGQAS